MPCLKKYADFSPEGNLFETFFIFSKKLATNDIGFIFVDICLVTLATRGKIRLLPTTRLSIPVYRASIRYVFLVAMVIYRCFQYTN